jgi:hypothetical protein
LRVAFADVRPDRLNLNVLINHHHPAAARISIVTVDLFIVNPRFFLAARFTRSP